MSELFENHSISIDALPKIEEETFLPIEITYKLFLQIRNALLFLLLLIIVGLFNIFGNLDLNLWYFIATYIGIVIAWILSFMLVNIGFPRKKYLLRQHDLLYKTGYIFEKTTAIPINRIQHIEIRQSILLRIFKLSKLVIYTAGGNSSDLSISGLKPEDAKQLKEFISKTISEHE